MKHIIEFLWLCSGAVPSVIKHLPRARRIYAGIGLAILSTALIACMSASYAFYALSENALLAFSFGVLWGLMIFNLDRYIVSNFRKISSARRASYVLNVAGRIFPRLAFAILISFTISIPIVVLLFDKEIEQQIQAERERPIREIDERIAQKKAEVLLAQESIRDKQMKMEEFRHSFFAELDGGGGTGVYGYGQVARIKERLYKEAQQEYEEARADLEQKIFSNSSELAILYEQRSQLLSQQKQAANFLERFRALSVLRKNNVLIAWAYLLITLLIIFIEISPVSVKLLLKRDEYEDKLALISKANEDEIAATSLTLEVNSKLQRAFSQALDYSNLNPKRQ